MAETAKPGPIYAEPAGDDLSLPWRDPRNGDIAFGGPDPALEREREDVDDIAEAVNQIEMFPEGGWTCRLDPAAGPEPGLQDGMAEMTLGTGADTAMADDFQLSFDGFETIQ